MCTGHHFLFSAQGAYSKRLFSFLSCITTFSPTLELSHQHSKYVAIYLIFFKKTKTRLHILFQLLFRFLVSFYISLKKEKKSLYSLFFFLQCHYSLNPLQTGFLLHHFIEAALMSWSPSCCQTQWSIINLHVTQPVSSIHTIYHSFWKYSILLDSRDPSLLVLFPLYWSFIHLPNL